MKILDAGNFVSEWAKVKPVTNAEIVYRDLYVNMVYD